MNKNQIKIIQYLSKQERPKKTSEICKAINKTWGNTYANILALIDAGYVDGSAKEGYRIQDPADLPSEALIL